MAKLKEKGAKGGGESNSNPRYYTGRRRIGLPRAANLREINIFKQLFKCCGKNDLLRFATPETLHRNLQISSATDEHSLSKCKSRYY